MLFHFISKTIKVVFYLSLSPHPTFSMISKLLNWLWLILLLKTKIFHDFYASQNVQKANKVGCLQKHPIISRVICAVHLMNSVRMKSYLKLFCDSVSLFRFPPGAGWSTQGNNFIKRCYTTESKAQYQHLQILFDYPEQKPALNGARFM